MTLQAFDDEDEAEIVLTVSDTGRGIAPEVRDRLFEPFVTTKPPGSGTGLGLAVCLSLVEGFGGKLTADNVEGGGARFTIHAPFRNEISQQSGASSA